MYAIAAAGPTAGSAIRAATMVLATVDAIRDAVLSRPQKMSVASRGSRVGKKPQRTMVPHPAGSTKSRYHLHVWSAL